MLHDMFLFVTVERYLLLDQFVHESRQVKFENRFRSIYKVSATWALDLDQYNEWMNEEDYEVDDSGQKRVHKYRLSVEDLMAQPSHPPPAKKPKRKRSPSPPPKLGKRKRYRRYLRSTPCSNSIRDLNFERYFLTSSYALPFYSSRAPSGMQSASSASSAAAPKKSRGGEEEEDLTQGMEDPPAEPRIVEVVATPTNAPITGQSNATTGNSTIASTGSKKQDSELQPLKSGNMADLDEPLEGERDKHVVHMSRLDNVTKEEEEEDDFRITCASCAQGTKGALRAARTGKRGITVRREARVARATNRKTT